MFERPRSGERAVLVDIHFDRQAQTSRLAEFRDLVHSAGAEAVAVVGGSRSQPDARFFVGTGKADEIRSAVQDNGGEVVIFNHALSPSQERNLERHFQCRVLDRAGLILDIFAQRARSHEGKLQVELAQLRHLSTRLVRGWTHLERQKGGIGLRGPGETQLETDRRLVANRIRQIEARLERVERRRGEGRRARRRAEIPTISLVGYTNAGKSTLFNRLTSADVFAADQLFATLDPTHRRIELPGAGAAILADTVGFISDLPHELVAAFRSTLQESAEAQLLFHVVDAPSPERSEKIAQVEQVLEDIGADQVPRIEVYNKVDLLESARPREPVRDADGLVSRLWVSAQTGEGLDVLLSAAAERLGPSTVHRWIHLPFAAGRIRARLFELGAVLSEHKGVNGEWVLEVRAPKRDLDRLARREGLEHHWLRNVP